MIVCSHCGTGAYAGDVNCRVCGARLETTAGAHSVPAAQPVPTPAPAMGVAPAASRGYQLPAGVGLVQSASQEGAARAATPQMPGATTMGTPAMTGVPGDSSAGVPSYAPQQNGFAVTYQPARPGYQNPYPYPNPYAGQYPSAYPSYQGQYPAPGYYMPPMPYAYPVRPPRAKGEIYRLVLAWIVIVGGALSIVVGLLMGLLGLVALVGPTRSGLATVNEAIALLISGVVGGVAGLYFGITAVLKRPSVRFSLPPAWIFLVLTVLVLGAGVVLWNAAPTPGPIQMALPLVILSGALPALTILAFTAGRLGNPSTWRHTALSLIHGATLAILLATILEPILLVLVVLVLNAIGLPASFNDALNLRPASTGEAVAVLLLLSGVAPLVEEGVKPLAAILLMPRLRGPAEAFLLGLAAGIGFDFVETLGYIGMGNADWISIALQRIGAGLLHGLGAGMGALGWYYLLRGKGVPRRWLLGFGGLLYAVVQHAIFNGSAFLQLVPGPVSRVFSMPLYLGQLPLDGGTGLFFGYYLVILGVLIFVTTRLGRAYRAQAPTAQPPQPAGGAGTTPNLPQPIAGGAR